MRQFVALIFLLTFSLVQAQNGLENIIVETYYISDANDATDTDGGALAEGAVTYRVYADMLPGYNFQAVYGNDNHTLRIATTTEFFNNADRGEQTGEAIGDNRVDENTVAVDSWISVGGATDEHLGVLKSEDTDGSIVGGTNNDGGSEGVAGGLLANDDANAGIPLTTADGLLPGTPVEVTTVGDLDLSMFADENSSGVLETNGGSWAALGGATGATAGNSVLIAQITTDGDLSFELNIQIGTPAGGVERYVASNPVGDEIVLASLTFPNTSVPGCTDTTACNFNPDATEDDGSCVLPMECEVCENGIAVLIDENNDDICDSLQMGCTDVNACNYDQLAVFDDASCILPGECEVCENGQAVLVDENNDDICDSLQMGCTNSDACNYDETAVFDNGSCVLPGACEICENGVAVLVDQNNDDICDSLQMGCTNSDACNYDADAVLDNGTCAIPDPECEECDGNQVVAIDLNNNNIPDCDEVIKGLEDVICEVYYVSDANDAGDTDGGMLPEGAATYRIYIDMLPGYNFQAVYGNDDHTLMLATSTEFFNNADRGESTGESIGDNRLDENTVALDSWVAVGGASDAHLGVLKSEDNDGSIVGGANNDGGSEGVAGGLLVNDDVLAGIALTTADGLVAGSPVETTVVGNVDLSIFADENSEDTLITNQGSWAALGGATGPTESNRVLIAQITTTGAFTFELNIQIGTPDGGTQRYVAKNPIGEEFQDDRLSGIKVLERKLGCTIDSACNYDMDATIDDGTCLVPVDSCTECEGDTLRIIDTDGDSICDALEIPGCTNPDAPNYDPNATDDDGSCIITGLNSGLHFARYFEVFPNPSIETITVNYVGEQALGTNWNYQLFDAQGQAVKSGMVMDQDVEIDLTSLPQGVYELRLLGGDQTLTTKVIKL